MKAVVVALAVTAGLGLSQVALADEALAKSSGCLACHNVEGAKKMGSSFKDISAKNKGKVDAAALAAKIGNKPHPAVKASPEDQKKLAAYILSL